MAYMHLDIERSAKTLQKMADFREGLLKEVFYEKNSLFGLVARDTVMTEKEIEQSHAIRMKKRNNTKVTDYKKINRHFIAACLFCPKS